MKIERGQDSIKLIVQNKAPKILLGFFGLAFCNIGLSRMVLFGGLDGLFGAAIGFLLLWAAVLYQNSVEIHASDQIVRRHRLWKQSETSLDDFDVVTLTLFEFMTKGGRAYVHRVNLGDSNSEAFLKCGSWVKHRTAMGIAKEISKLIGLPLEDKTVGVRVECHELDLPIGRRIRQRDEMVFPAPPEEMLTKIESRDIDDKTSALHLSLPSSDLRQLGSEHLFGLALGIVFLASGCPVIFEKQGIQFWVTFVFLAGIALALGYWFVRHLVIDVFVREEVVVDDVSLLIRKNRVLGLTTEDSFWHADIDDIAVRKRPDDPNGNFRPPTISITAGEKELRIGSSLSTDEVTYVCAILCATVAKHADSATNNAEMQTVSTGRSFVGRSVAN